MQHYKLLKAGQSVNLVNCRVYPDCVVCGAAWLKMRSPSHQITLRDEDDLPVAKMIIPAKYRFPNTALLGDADGDPIEFKLQQAD